MKDELQFDSTIERNPNDSDPLLDNHRRTNSSQLSDDIIELKDEVDVEAGSFIYCRICLECDGDDDDELISPCMCKGTQQFVHRSCLDQWRSVKEGFAFSHCTTCKAQFHLRVIEFEDNSWRKFKFRFFVTRDIFLVFLAVQMAIAAMGGFVYLLDKDGTFRNSFDDSWDRILSSHPIPFYYCMGFLLFFTLLGLIGVIIHCSTLSFDGQMGGFQNNYYGWAIYDCSAVSAEACVGMVIICGVIFALLGIAYSFFVATMAIQRIWQRHFHILAKKELTKEYVVEDLHGCYTPPKLDEVHEELLKKLQLL
ncbi:uncharacterized protein LOC124911850 [Impatiens glandulifera]|uniref:uncharacterized protein LOC124911850 n=1 Tax=Impatiens glandulifera TaxID=253017 RepID=UPI001FB08D30|nr:uncharacterized protein LOC124911850 [Impatiens glandulifera]